MKPSVIPAAVLAAALSLCLINSVWLTRRCSDWDGQLESVDSHCRTEDWAAAGEQLETLYLNWQSVQPWLHIILDHDLLNEAEMLFCRARVLVQEEDSVEFRSHISDLRSQLMLLAELEQPRVENIL